MFLEVGMGYYETQKHVKLSLRLILDVDIDDSRTVGGVVVLGAGEFPYSGARSIFTAVAQGRMAGYFR